MWLWLDDPRSPLELAPGDVAFVRGGPDHFIAHKPNAACLPPEQFQARHADDERASAHGADVFLCGAYVLSGDVGRGLLESLGGWRVLQSRGLRMRLTRWHARRPAF